MRPAPPLRPNLLNSSTASGGGSSGGRSDGGGSGVASLNTLSSYCSGRKNQPTFEEDALVLRVFEAYCAAYQNSTRNTIHSGESLLTLFFYLTKKNCCFGFFFFFFF